MGIPGGAGSATVSREYGGRPPAPGAPVRGVGRGAGNLAVRSPPSPAHLVLQPVPPAPHVRVPGGGVPDTALAQAALEPDHFAFLVAHLRHSALLSRPPPTQSARFPRQGHSPRPVGDTGPSREACALVSRLPSGLWGSQKHVTNTPSGAPAALGHCPVPLLRPLPSQGCRHPLPVHRAPASALSWAAAITGPAVPPEASSLQLRNARASPAGLLSGGAKVAEHNQKKC